MEKKLIPKVFLFLLVMAFAASVAGCGSGGGNPSKPSRITLSLPSPDALRAGDVVTASVMAHEIGDTFYAAFDLNYDDRILEFVGADEGTFLNRNGADPTAFRAALQNGQVGKVAVGLTRLGGIGPVSGSGTLVTVSFKAVGSGVSALAFGSPRGVEDGGDQEVLVSDWEDGSVTVE